MLLVGGVLAVSIIVAFVASRYKVPVLVAFLLFGMLLGVDGPGHISFTNVEVAKLVGTIGLIAILFEGGLTTSRRRLREAIIPATLLSTIGVLVTFALTGVAVHYLFDFPWALSMLMGAVVSSTDAAAVFATLRFAPVRRRLARILEAESGLNDPMAIALTIGFITWIEDPGFGFGDFTLLMVEKLVIGALVGIIFGWAAEKVFGRIPKSVGAFAPVASVAAALISFSMAELLGGSGYLAIYMVAVAIGSTPSRYRAHMVSFHEGVAFVAQVAMFILMGMFVIPHNMWKIFVPSIALAIFLVVIARPIAVLFSTLYGCDVGKRDRLFLGWAGLRGAVPIVLGMYVLSAEIEHGQMLFNAVFFVVLLSAALQGTTLDWVARKLGVVDRFPAEKAKEFADVVEKIFFRVAPSHSIARAKISELGLPAGAAIVEVRRRGKPLREVDRDTVVRVRDLLTIEAPYSIHPEVEDVFTRWRQRI